MTIPLVEVVGCLAQAANNGWVVTNATEPTHTAAVWSKPEEVKAAEAKALGYAAAARDWIRSTWDLKDLTKTTAAATTSQQ